jgi:hypothetical protein
MISIGLPDISRAASPGVMDVLRAGRAREISRRHNVARCSRLLGRDPPWVVTMVCRNLSVGGVSSKAISGQLLYQIAARDFDALCSGPSHCARRRSPGVAWRRLASSMGQALLLLLIPRSVSQQGLAPAPHSENMLLRNVATDADINHPSPTCGGPALATARGGR